MLDNNYYVQLSDRLTSEGKLGIPESDDLNGSSTGLGRFYWPIDSLSNMTARHRLWPSQMGERISCKRSR